MRAGVCGLGCWLGIAALAAGGAASGAGALAPGYLLLCVLLVLAPACLALPAGQALRAPWWAVETVLAWAALGYLLLFVNPQLLGRGLALIIVLLICSNKQFSKVPSMHVSPDCSITSIGRYERCINFSPTSLKVDKLSGISI